jgi:hypothetical protein
MAGRSSALSRVRSYFREAPVDEVEVAFELVKRDIAERMSKVPQKAAAVARKPRRTKAQMAQDKAAMQAHTATPIAKRPAEGVGSVASTAEQAAAVAGS